MILKIVLTLPHNIDKMNTPAWHCIEQLPETIAGYKIRAIASYSANIADARNHGVNESDNTAKAQNDFNFDKLLFVDYDIEFTAANIALLLAEPYMIIGGIYKRRNGQWETLPRNIDVTGSPIIVDSVGAGFLLVDRIVFLQMPFPWFWFDRRAWTDNNNIEHCVPGAEDVTFCTEAAKHGFIIYAHTGCIVKHIKGGCMNVPQQQISETTLENNIMRACTQVQASTQMLVDHVRILATQNNSLREEVKKLKEKLVPCQTEAEVKAE